MRIAIYAFDDVTMFHLAAPLMVFGEVQRLGLASDWETTLWSDSPGSIRTSEGYVLGDVVGPDVTTTADIVIVPSWHTSLPRLGDTVGHAVREAHSRGAVIVGLCLGAFAVADAGLLEGRSVVTHWAALADLAERSDGSTVDPSVLYIDHGDVVTSAGTVSSIDACLHLVRKHLGTAAATRVARQLVIAPHREGGQAQYIERPLGEPAADTTIADVQEWILGHLDEELSIDRLADHARMSRRSFVRHFARSTGATPARWVLERRLDESRRLLETTDWSIDAVASACGFGSPVTFRQRFAASFSTTPSEYRRHFTSRDRTQLPA
ncbi:helix-turn-helix domain-containing protein [Rhodococcus sp. BP-241]|uniref:GlxA family transcriptional regulator n=1 Tax=Rhodococcus sp. BP-241 TaxID=2739441 RepID=UPI001C9AB434|nr:helix-turn-helix domain-containing protein [Rhodococcus sp. BP-241]MBY6708775.1 helix-turn-helix domain-containing protein [Rhodococcus sp. BP-241]